MMKKLLLILCITSSFQPTNTMLAPKAANKASNKIAQYFTKEGFKNGFSKGMTAYHWYLAGGPLFKMGYEKAKQLVTIEKNSDSYKQPNSSVSQFIMKEMPALKSENNIKIDDSLTNNIMVSGPHIVIAENAAAEINSLLDQNNTYGLNQYRSILQWENQGIQNKDTYTQILACLAIPLTTHWLCRTLGNSLSLTTKAPSFFRKQLSKVITGTAKRCINKVEYNALNRYQINQADDGIDNDLDILNGLKSYLQPQADQENTEFKELSDQSNISVKKWNEIKNVIGTYPSLTSRIEKLNERITLLECREHADHRVEEYRKSNSNQND